ADQFLDARQHAIEVLRQAIELVAGAIERDALGEIAGHDGAAGVGNRLDAPQHAPADGEPGADPEDGEQCDAPQAELAHAGSKAVQVFDVATDDEDKAAGHRHGYANGEPRHPRLALRARARIGEDAAPRGTVDFRRHAIEIARDLASGGI